MVSASTVRAQVSDLRRFGPGLVGVFVGGTSGIGETTAREFVRYTVKPRVYLVGRNQEQGTKLTAEFRELNPESQVDFIQSDTSLLQNVDKICDDIKSREDKVNLLFLSAGMMTTGGRNETPEGLDKKFSLHYYSRIRFAHQLLPLLNKAGGAAAPGSTSTPDTSSPSAPLSRVIFVLAAGHEVGNLNTADLSLKNNFTLKACADHATTMGTLAFQQLAETNPAVGFVHSAPGGVNTNLLREFGTVTKVIAGIAGVVLKPLFVPLRESGERHLWAATNEKFAGGEAYLVGSDGEKPKNDKVLSQLKEKGLKEIVWTHTMEVFQKVREEGGKY